jgi:hypothetical protein
MLACTTERLTSSSLAARPVNTIRIEPFRCPQRQTVYLPIAGLVDPSELKPGELIGTNKDSYLILEKLPAEYVSALTLRVPARWSPVPRLRRCLPRGFCVGPQTFLEGRAGHCLIFLSTPSSFTV